MGNKQQATVVRERLTDRSEVFNVRIVSADGPTITLACVGRAEANALAAAINVDVVDVSVR